MPGTNAGTGCPIAFVCPVYRRSKLFGYGAPDAHHVTVTGHTKKNPGRKISARMDRESREYECSCGHRGWSAHVDLKFARFKPTTGERSHV